MSMLTLLQSMKLLMVRYMVTPPALRLGDDDATTDDAVAICLRLAVLQYDLRSQNQAHSLAWNIPSNSR
ncbi:hypothetical protein TNCT_165501 [Trichonephila clavata]|uniref:Secreted protein n=1 Tax=Trichonephila clavata TaxID=2740835 RepID=A0A8X6M2C3_TRICU|nr:hypothetical protein TNCT_165501 [Trichonephila clavata]